jgi:hypothetical protein
MLILHHEEERGNVEAGVGRVRTIDALTLSWDENRGSSDNLFHVATKYLNTCNTSNFPCHSTVVQVFGCILFIEIVASLISEKNGPNVTVIQKSEIQ